MMDSDVTIALAWVRFALHIDWRGAPRDAAARPACVRPGRGPYGPNPVERGEPTPPDIPAGQLGHVWNWLERNGFGPLTAALVLDRFPQAPEAAAMRLHFRRSLARNLALATAARSALDTLDAARIPALTFKGPALALQAYGGLDRRSFSDVDVLVPVEAVPDALLALAQAGWQSRLDLNRWQRAAFLRNFAALELTRLHDGVQLDLHWRFSESWFPVDAPVAAMLARRCPVSFAEVGPALTTLAPADHFVAVAIHSAKQAWQEPRLIADAAAAAACVPPDAWPDLLATARDRGYRRILALTLALAHAQWALPLPDAIDPILAHDPATARLAPQLLAAAMRDTPPPALPRWRQLAAFRERRCDGWLGAANLLMRQTPRDWALLPLPRALSPLYLPLRWARLLAARLAAQRGGA